MMHFMATCGLVQPLIYISLVIFMRALKLLYIFDLLFHGKNRVKDGESEASDQED